MLVPGVLVDGVVPVLPPPELVVPPVAPTLMEVLFSPAVEQPTTDTAIMTEDQVNQAAIKLLRKNGLKKHA
jgi:hypothetical protein